MLNEEETTSSGSKGAERSEEASAADKVHDAAEQMRSAAEQRVQSIRQATDSAKARTAARVRKFGRAVRKAGEHMRVEDQIYLADRANRACERIDGLADYIEHAELDTLIHDAEGMARQRPGLVFGGAFLIGLAAGRFLKVTPSMGDEQPAPERPQSLPARHSGNGGSNTEAGGAR